MVRLDQHFMIDDVLLKKIAAFGTNKIVTEIGGGTGNLTKHLIATAKKLNVIEKDATLAKKLRKQFPTANVIYGNALESELEGVIIANIPYAISEPLFYRLIKEPHITYLTIGKKFADSLVSEHTKLGIYAKTFFDVSVLQEIPREAFDPAPAVTSNLVSLVPKKYGLLGDILIQYDKKIKNAIITALSKRMTQKEAKRIVEPLFRTLADKKIFHLSNAQFIHVYEVVTTQLLQHDASEETNHTTQQP